MPRFIHRFIFVLLIALISCLQITNVLAKTSNDPYQEQWGYTDTGVYRAWDIATGSRDVIVAIIDNGFDTFHPDLAENVWKNINEIPDNGRDDDNNGYVDDVWGWNFVAEDNNHDGIITGDEAIGNNNPRPRVNELTRKDREEKIFHHGTVVAGIIGAVGNNGIDGVGINWAVRLMNVKAVTNEGSGFIAPVAPAIRYAVDNGAHIINISMVGDVDEALKQAVEYAYNKGVVVVAAAGNDYLNLSNFPRYPICHDANLNKTVVLGVSAIGQDHKLARFSNTGTGCIDITAPGVGINSTARYDQYNDLPATYLKNWDGTSFAAPFISAAAALIKSIKPTWKAPQIYEAILNNVHRTPPKDLVAYENMYGKGLIQIDKAVAAASGQDVEILSLKPSSDIPVSDTSTSSFSSANTATPPVTPPPTDKRKIVAIDLARMEFDELSFESGNQSRYSRVLPTGIDAVANFSHKGETWYAIARAKNKKTREIIIYNRKWREQARWNIQVAYPVTLSLGDTTGDDIPEIVVAPSGKQNEIFRVYSLSGSLLHQVKIKKPHEGVSIGVTEGQVVAVFWQNGKLSANRYDGSKLVQQFHLPDLGKNASLALFNIDSDAQTEYVFASGPGASPLISYYDNDGTHNFSVSPFAEISGLSNAGLKLQSMAPASGDRGQFLVYTPNKAGPVIALNHRAKTIGSWDFFAGEDIARMRLLTIN